VLPRSTPAGAAPECGGEPAGAKRVRVVAVLWVQRRVRGADGGRVAGAGHSNPARWGKGRGAEYGAPVPPCGGCPAGPLGGVIQGEWPAERRRGRRVGAPASTQGPIKAG